MEKSLSSASIINHEISIKFMAYWHPSIQLQQFHQFHIPQKPLNVLLTLSATFQQLFVGFCRFSITVSENFAGSCVGIARRMEINIKTDLLYHKIMIVLYKNYCNLDSLPCKISKTILTQ